MINKLKEVCIQINLPFLLLFAYLITCIYRVPNIAEAIIAIGLVGLFAFKLWMDFVTKPDPAAEMEQRIKKVESAIGGLAMGNMASRQKNPSGNFNWHNKG